MNSISKVLFILFLIHNVSFAQKSVQNGGTLDWSNVNTWSPSGLPDASDDISWANNRADGLNVSDGTFEAGDFSPSKNGGVLTIASDGVLNLASFAASSNSFTIQVDGTLNIQGILDASQTLTINVSSSGSLIIGGSINSGNNLTLNIDPGGVLSANSFTSGNNATVLINGDMSIEGGFALGGGSSSIAVNGILTAGSIDTSNKPISGTGTVTASSCTNVDQPGSAATVNCSGGPLPVTLLFFNARTTQQSEVQLTWATASEENFHYFVVERSTDGENFELVTTVESTGGNTNIRQDYQLTDANPYFGLNYYQLTSIDYDGYTEVFPLAAVQVNEQIQPQIYPNPSLGTEIFIQGIGQENPYNIIIYSLNGALYYQAENVKERNIQLTPVLAEGMYVARITIGKQQFSQKIIVK